VRTLRLIEYGTAPGVHLTRTQRDALRRLAPSLSVVPTEGTDDRYDVTAGSEVGAIRVGDLALEIHPKLPVSRLLFLLSYAIDPAHWRDIPFAFPAAASLFEAIIPGFVGVVRQAIQRGLLRGYQEREDPLSTVRGRIRIAQQIRRRFGLAPPVEVSFDEFTEDVVENRLIRAALARLLRLRARSPVVHHLLRSTERRFGDVEAVEYGAGNVPSVVYTRLNEHYRQAVELARLILRSISFDLGQGPVYAGAFLIDLSRVFEAFVVTALREALGLSESAFPRGAAGRQLYLDEARRVRVRPDLSWWVGARCVFAGDVKYCLVDPTAPFQNHLYQLLAYAISADVPAAVLVYAAGEGEPGVYRVSNAGKELHVAALDLAAEPEMILEQVRGLANRIQGLAMPPSANAVFPAASRRQPGDALAHGAGPPS
jgi:5-methylcytosine-specific restriction enzyme subunit McrC